MKNLYLKKQLITRLCLMAVIALIGIVYGCRKDQKDSTGSPTITDPKVMAAKTWYESSFPKTNTKTTTRAVNATGTGFDWSQLIKPDWQHAQSYNRFDQAVLEVPIDPSVKFRSALQNKNTSQMASQKEYSYSSFLLLNDGEKYEAYVMTVIADAAYIKNDVTRLRHNTYSKHDSDFTGMVLYFTPKGKYVSGYGYKNGRLLTPSAGVGQAAGQQVQGINPKVLKPATTPVYETCIDWFIITYDDYGIISAEFLFTECYTSGSTPPGSGGGGGGGGSGGTTAPSPPPPACYVGSEGGLNSINPLIVNTVPTPNDPPGGFPPPVKKCPEVVDPDPCAQARALANNATFKSKMNDLKSRTGLLKEVGYTIDAQGIYTNVAGAIGAGSINLTPTAPISGYIHTHYKGTFPTFSGSDVRAIYQLQKQGKVSNISSFTAGVVTASGTTYLMKISDPVKFVSFAAAKLDTDADFKMFEDYYKNNQIIYKFANNDDINSYELALLEALKDSGVTILKGNTTFSSWDTLTKSDGNNMTDKIKIINCN